MTAPVVLVCDASPAAGLGHLSRSTAVAHALAEAGTPTDRVALGAAEAVIRDGLEWRPLADLTTLVARRQDAAAFVLDAYGLDRSEVSSIAAVAPLVWFDDFGAAPVEAALVVAPAGERLPGTTQTVLTGLEHAPLGRRFWVSPRREVAITVSRVLVTMGGSDPAGATPRIATAAAEGAADAEIVVVRGPHAQLDELPPGITVAGPLASLGDELATADLVVGAAGQTMLEAAALGTPALVAIVAENQIAGARELERRGAVVLFDPADPDELRERVGALSADRGARARMSAAGQAAIDGQGAGRIASAIAGLAR